MKDKLHQNIFGLGFYGIGKHKKTHKGRATKCYNTWYDMMRRCYCPKSLLSRPTYKGCSVDSDWHNFQNFAQWFDENYIAGFELDKDVKVDGNKIYSSKNCLFISHKDNVIKSSAKRYRFKNPKGEVVDIYNMKQFCKDNNLHPAHMCSVSKGRLKSHKGWVLYI